MASGERRKCKGCNKLFRPDPRNRYYQRCLRGPELSRREQSRQPGSLACRSREPGLLPRPDECRPGQSMAIASSRLLAQETPRRRCVTRSLIGATH